ncbi:MotA/TolQ/ExbB proton channel family protein [Telmatospirillum sp.]|uniref:MotA/TolQ/ExbB proton channel family protein n=1 Tax=Telmatospirillum sp. TaxID=2079197 RepID=UPI00284C2C4B|nr:MotA/TolQ/ExbB proton channel family protein [Telmatospirillum sp.]MDR3436874.1 MotA/TolQ/ExbB proton channel family protein [Telmatospirillum sp.]
MTFNMQLLHIAIFHVLYAAAALATFVVVERTIFYWVTLRDARKLEAVLTPAIQHVRELPGELIDRDSLPAEAVRRMLQTKFSLPGRSDMEDFAESLYIAMKAKLHRHVWILDTVVTAAPLLGLLGTILGIIDTFAALATSGVSDPSAVSQGIGTALYATALGISVALYGLLFHNLFQVRITTINDHLKILLLRAGIGESEEPSPGVSTNRLAFAE